MQSSGERTTGADQKWLSPATTFHAHLMAAMSASLSAPYM
jgi:hypothetical protein